MRARLAHDLHGSGPAGPALEAQRTLLDQDLEAVDHLRSTAPRLLRQHRCRRSGRPGRPRTRIHRRNRPSAGSSLNVLDGSASPTEVQLTSTSAAHRRGDRARRRARPRARAARSGVRFQTATVGARLRQRVGRGARASRPRRGQRACAARRSPSAASSPGASVLSAAMAPPGAKVSVLAAPMARAAVGGLVGQRERRLLVRDRDVGAGEARAGQGAHGLGEELGRRPAGAGSASRSSPTAAQRGVVHRRRAAVGDRPAEDAEPGQAQGPTPPRRSTAMCTTTPGGGSSIGGNFTSGPR